MIGSSPYIRGTSGNPNPSRHNRRFIPVHTGNIRNNIPCSKLGAVHPRTYGEHPYWLSPLRYLVGSSPYIRGTSGGTTGILFRTRFIPVHTGNIHHPVFVLDRDTVHPRTYGEHRSSMIFLSFSFGSSPYIRGTWSSSFPC